MKTMNLSKVLAAVLLGLFFIVNISFAADAKEVEIKTSAQCGMCKKTIEKGLNKLEGIRDANVDVKTALVTVKYDPKETNVDEIRIVIAKTGYDADDVEADKKAYGKLMSCCKKPKD